jgi:hypothetical protein
MSDVLLMLVLWGVALFAWRMEHGTRVTREREERHD